MLRGERVMLDAGLAELYGVETKTLNRAVKRHRDRFPQDFMFQLTAAHYSFPPALIPQAGPAPPRHAAPSGAVLG